MSLSTLMPMHMHRPSISPCCSAPFPRPYPSACQKPSVGDLAPSAWRRAVLMESCTSNTVTSGTGLAGLVLMHVRLE